LCLIYVPATFTGPKAMIGQVRALPRGGTFFILDADCLVG
jgi:hypothetical protein